MKLEGLYTALITPFDSHGKLDEKGLRHNLRYQLQHEVQGIVVLGSTGETPTLNGKEKRTILEIAVEEAKGKTTVIAGTGSYSTEQTLAATREAQEIGADAALVITPYYNKPTQEGLYRHFATLCHATTLPICIYNNPGRTGQNIDTDTLKRLAAFPSIIGIKDCSGNIRHVNDIWETLEKRQPHFALLAGDDDLVLPLMALGGHGVISIVGNLLPGPIQSLVQAAAAGDFALARRWHYFLLPLFKAAFIETNPIPIKAAMSLWGMPAGPCRLPLCELSPEHFSILQQILDRYRYGQTQSPCIETECRLFVS